MAVPLWTWRFGNVFNRHRISELQHKRHLLMYHDKRFQRDSQFILIIFNHMQIKESTTGGYLVMEKQSFGDISDRLMNLDQDVLETLSNRMASGEHVKPVTQEEKDCFQLIKECTYCIYSYIIESQPATNSSSSPSNSGSV